MKYLSISVLLVAFFVAVSPVWAHVTMKPGEVVAGYQTLHVSVPNEKSIPTTSVHLMVPKGAIVVSMQSVPGWTRTETREVNANAKAETEAGHSHDEGVITSITWTGSLPVGEFVAFPVVVKFDEPGEYAWAAHQTYADGTVVSWDGHDEGHSSPKSTVLTQSKVDDVSSRLASLDEMVKKEASEFPWLSGVAIVLSVVAIGISRRQ